MRPSPCWGLATKTRQRPLQAEPIACPGSGPGAFLGGRLAADLDEDHMKLGFGGVMVALGARTLLKAL